MTIIMIPFVQFAPGVPSCPVSSTERAGVSFHTEIKIRFCQIDIIKELRNKEDMRIGDNMK